MSRHVPTGVFKSALLMAAAAAAVLERADMGADIAPKHCCNTARSWTRFGCSSSMKHTKTNLGVEMEILFKKMVAEYDLIWKGSGVSPLKKTEVDPWRESTRV